MRETVRRHFAPLQRALELYSQQPGISLCFSDGPPQAPLGIRMSMCMLMCMDMRIRTHPCACARTCARASLFTASSLRALLPCSS